ncbi:nicolin-1 isoform X2 [Erpetoichthys calabaricus]|uniref:nicolin-1 isoform X2 n=1 Tax=Erpetoichthys calabaricus TaxID=27687 RepID=UPI0022341654|nr:nicolin-1 isoform X2 [Erpetoichthys calabaricus]
MDLIPGSSSMCDNMVACSIKAPVSLQIGNMFTDAANPGVLVIDAVSPECTSFNLQEISFKNNYTAFLMVRLHKQDPNSPGNVKWVTCLRNYQLMPCPHTEEGAQDYFSISRQQDSEKTLPSWLSSLTPVGQAPKCQNAIPDPDKISSSIQQMWALTEVMQSSKTTARVGRFDVDGCYDINLLSYT